MMEFKQLDLNKYLTQRLVQNKNKHIFRAWIQHLVISIERLNKTNTPLLLTLDA